MRTVEAREDTDLQNTRNFINSASQLVYLPETIISIAGTLAGSDICPCEQSLEGRVDDEEILIGSQRSLFLFPGMGQGRQSKIRLDAAKLLEFGQDLVNSDRSDFDGDIFPGFEEAGLELSRVWFCQFAWQ